MKNSNGWYRPTRKTRRKYEHPIVKRKDNGTKVISAIKKNHDDIVIQDDRIRGGIGPWTSALETTRARLILDRNKILSSLWIYEYEDVKAVRTILLAGLDHLRNIGVRVRLQTSLPRLMSEVFFSEAW